MPLYMTAPARARRKTMLSWELDVRRHVERHLSDPSLDAVAIAKAYGVSVRFIHIIFARIGRTTAAFILERRLASVSVALRAQPTVPISRLVLDAGFADLSHFCHSFRRRFGMTARDYRRGAPRGG
jgi:AraC-like DNA-binding protein